MRTNIVVDETLIKEIMQLSEAKTQKQVIEKSIKSYLRFLAQQDLLNLIGMGKVVWEGDLDAMRSSKSDDRE